VKRKAGLLAILGLGALALGVYVGGAVVAEPPRAAGTPSTPSVLARTRIALVNLHEVFKNYRKFQVFREQLKAEADGYERVLKDKNQRLEALQNEYKKTETTQQRKDQIESEARTIKIEMEDVKQTATKKLTKIQDDQLTTIYLEVDQVVRDYAKGNEIDLVLRYNEEWTNDFYSPENVVRRLNMAFWPMYYDKSMDITNQVLDVLNRKYASAGTPNTNTNVVPASVKPPNK
jgi:Skp family chaperone for outer membrane proteins